MENTMVEHNVAEKMAENATIGGGITAIIGGWTSTDIASYGGFLMAFIGLLINLYFKLEANKRAKILHAKRLAKLEEEDEL